ncbi:MAG: hypothetical protein V3U52_00970 [Thermoplasmata archaeon]
MKVRLQWKGGDEEELDRLVLYHLKRAASTSVYISGKEKEAGRLIYRVGICAREILDDLEKRERRIRFLKMPNLAEYELYREARHWVLDGPPPTRLGKAARDVYDTLVGRSQRVLLKHVYKQLVSIDRVKLAMSPIAFLLGSLQFEGSVNPDDLWGKRKNSQKIANYVTLLVDLGLVDRENGNLVPGDYLKRLEGIDDEEEIHKRVMAYALERRYPYMKEVLRWTMMVPFLEASNTYYFGALEADTRLYWDADTYRNRHSHMYRRLSQRYEFLDRLRRMANADVITRQGKLWTATDSIYSHFVESPESRELLAPFSL